MHSNNESNIYLRLCRRRTENADLLRRTRRQRTSKLVHHQTRRANQRRLLLLLPYRATPTTSQKYHTLRSSITKWPGQFPLRLRRPPSGLPPRLHPHPPNPALLRMPFNTHTSSRIPNMLLTTRYTDSTPLASTAATTSQLGSVCTRPTMALDHGIRYHESPTQLYHRKHGHTRRGGDGQDHYNLRHETSLLFICLPPCD